jgi:hypothetical protein
MQTQTIIKFAFILIAIINVGASPFALADDGGDALTKNEVSSLCDKRDLIFFTCTTENKKIISLCGKGTPDNVTGVYYRFGRKGKVEMDFPKNKDESSIKQFSHERFPSEEIAAVATSFNNNDYTYTIFDVLFDGKVENVPELGDTHYSGVTVRKKETNENVANIQCSSGYATNVFHDNEKLKDNEE